MLSVKAEHRLEVLLRVAGLARSTFFYHQARLHAPDPHAALKADIARLFDKNKGRYGHRRVHDQLRKKGWRVAKKTVLKLMNQLGLVCRVRRKKPYSSYRGQAGRVAPNLLERDFTAQEPNQKWVTDVSEFVVAGHKVYLSPVMDLFDRQIISYTAGLSPNLELTNASLRAALKTLADGQSPLVHSDQGFQGGFNWSSQHLDHEGVRWDASTSRYLRCLRERDGSGRRIGRCDLRCAHRAALSPLVRCSGTSGGESRRA